MSWKKLFRKIQEDCLVLDHRLYLSGMKAFLGHFWPDTSNQVSTHEDILFGERCWFKFIRIAV